MSNQEGIREQKGRLVGSPLSSLEFTHRNFDNPALERRRLFAEILGTFLLVLAAAGGGVVDAVSHGQISRAAQVTAPGLMVLAVILFMGAISGAHLNPVVSIAFAARGDFPWRRVPGYLLAQLGDPPWRACFCGHCSASKECWERPNRVRASATGRRW